MIKTRIGIIGCGNMGEALLARLIAVLEKSTSIIVCEKDPVRRDYIRRKYKMIVAPDTAYLLQYSDVVILAVKPAEIEELLREEIAPDISDDTLVISIAAGITTRFIEKILGAKTRVIRMMPNMAATIGEGISSVSAGTAARKGDVELAADIFSLIGEVVEVEEKQVDAVTAVSGSGPAYFFYLAEILIAAAKKAGLPEEVARKLVIKTAAGSGKLLAAAKEGPEELRRKVTSKGGTTEAAFKVIEAKKIKVVMADAVKAAAKRSKEMAKG